MPVYGASARVRGARERGGPRPGAGRTLERDETRSRGSEPSSGAGPLEGGVAPRTGRNPPEAERAPERGGACSRGLLRGPSRWAVGVPRRGPCPAWLVTCMVRLSVFCGIQVRISPLFKGTPRAVPDRRYPLPSPMRISGQASLNQDGSHSS
jgi:hypothetical protein